MPDCPGRAGNSNPAIAKFRTVQPRTLWLVSRKRYVSCWSARQTGYGTKVMNAPDHILRAYPTRPHFRDRLKYRRSGRLVLFGGPIHSFGLAIPAAPFYSPRLIAPKVQRNNHTATGIVDDADAAVMRLHDLRDDCEAETCSRGSRPLSSPEPLEQMIPLLWRDPQPAIRNAYASIGVSADRHLAAQRGMCDDIFDQISDCIADRVSIPFDDDWLVLAVE